MQIRIQARNFPLTDALRNHTLRRLRLALNGKTDYIRLVMVRLSDINGPKGGNDKRCHILVNLYRLPKVVAMDTAEDLYAAINLAAKRAGNTVKNRVSRRRANKLPLGNISPRE